LIIGVVGSAYFQANPADSTIIFNKVHDSIVELRSKNEEDSVSYGSAVIINKDGTLISNAHLVTYKQGGSIMTFSYFEVRFSNETEYRRVDLLSYDINKDIAVLKIEDLSELKLKPVKLGDSTKIVFGEMVYAVGNAMNHGISITEGIISLPEVIITYDGIRRDVIQADIIINEGNSGGGLFNNKGELIGITTFRIKDNTGNPIYGIAFSVPVKEVSEYLSLISI
jgi:S1-C subfamily serine protease